MWSWTANALFTGIRRQVKLTIPLPTKLTPLRMYIEHGDLVVVLRPLAECLPEGLPVFDNGRAVPVKEHLTGVCGGAGRVEGSSSIY